MPSSVKLFLFILALPFIMAVAHDAHLNFMSTPEKMNEFKSLRIDPDKFEATAIGWIWTQYSPGTYKMAQDATSEDTWRGYIVPILKMKAIIVTLAPFVIGVFITLILWLFGIGPFKHLNRFKSFKAKKEYSVYSNEKTNKVKYGRK